MKIEVNSHSTYIDDSARGIVANQPTILWIPGAGMEAHLWALQARHFAFNGWNSLAITRPGHGTDARASDGPFNDTVEAEADWLVDVLDTLGLKTATVVGHSLGSLIAMDFAARHPDRCDKLVMLAAAPAIPVHPGLIASAGDNLDIADDLIVGWGFGVTGHHGGNRSIGSWMTGGARQMLGNQRDGTLHSDLVMCNAYSNGTSRAAEITVPTLVYLAAQDRMTPIKAGKKLAELIPHATLMVHPNSGHMIQVERPDDTLKAVKSFLSTAC